MQHAQGPEKSAEIHASGGVYRGQARGLRVPLIRTGKSQADERNTMRKEMMESINRHIASLPSKQRLAVLLFDVEGLSIKEVAEELGCSEGAVKFNIHEGRKKLKAVLGPLVTNLRDTVEE